MINGFFNPGHPKYDIRWKSEKIFNGYYTYLRIEQTQTVQDLFIMPVDITFMTEKGDTTIQIFNNERVQHFEFRLSSKPIEVIFDKDTLLFLKEVEYGTTTLTPLYSYSLKQNYPNPFNPITKIEYSISNSELVRLIIYDILGREIKTLVNEEKQPGVYGVELNASQLSSGIYFYKLTAGKFSETRKMLLLK